MTASCSISSSTTSAAWIRVPPKPKALNHPFLPPSLSFRIPPFVLCPVTNYGLGQRKEREGTSTAEAERDGMSFTFKLDFNTVSGLTVHG